MAAGLAPPTPLAPTATTTERREYFVPLADYHELPPSCYEANLIRLLRLVDPAIPRRIRRCQPQVAARTVVDNILSSAKSVVAPVAGVVSPTDTGDQT